MALSNQEMLSFPHFLQINESIDRIVANKARYRIVLTTDL